MFRFISFTVTMVFVLALLVGGASADTFYVSPTGNDRNSGTSQSQPFRVVQHAIDQMQTGLNCCFHHVRSPRRPIIWRRMQIKCSVWVSGSC